MADEKVCIVTGSNTGVGFNVAGKLAKKGFHVILACRTPEKGQAAAEAIINETEGANVTFMQLDLASLKSVRQFADDFHATGKPLHLLCNNAGMSNFNTERFKSEDGFELHMASNHLGHFLLTLLLLEDLKTTAAQGEEARIVVTASSTHDPKGRRAHFAHIDFDNLMLEKEGTYHGQLAYSNTKLANVLFTYELARRLEGTGVTANCTCPGFIPDTDANRHAAAFTRFLLAYPLGWFLRWKGVTSTIDEGGDNILLLAADESLKGVTGKYYRYLAAVESSEESYDREVAKKIWDVSSDLVGYKQKDSSLDNNSNH